MTRADSSPTLARRLRAAYASTTRDLIERVKPLATEPERKGRRGGSHLGQ
jgi:hypothetical protein